MTTRDTGRRFGFSLLIGLLLIPLSAAAGFAIVNGMAAQPPESETTLALAPIPEPTTTTAPSTEIVVEPVSATPSDLLSACTTDGMTLVAAESDATITDVQQAALDALRQICEEAGTPLPGPAAPPPIIQTVVHTGNPGTTSAAGDDSSGQSGYDDDHEDEHEEDEHEEDEEDEHEEKHEEEHEEDDD